MTALGTDVACSAFRPRVPATSLTIVLCMSGEGLLCNLETVYSSLALAFIMSGQFRRRLSLFDH